jgi:hypothetical protein
MAGVLAVSAVASCKSKGDAPTVAANAPAGRVVELTGKVDATRNGATRALAMGAEVFADDQIATAADGTVTIELFHNNARWAVVSNKKSRVDASLAWGLDKQQASKAVEHNSAAAGRNAERSAADTSSTTGGVPQTEAAPAAAPITPSVAPGAAPSTGAVPPPPPPPPPPAVGAGQSRGGKGGDSRRDVAPPPKTKAAPQAGSVTQKSLELSQQSDRAKNAPMEAPAASVDERAKASDDADEIGGGAVVSNQTVADRHRAAFEKCLDPKASKVTITLSVRMNKTTVKLAGPGTTTGKVKPCVEAEAKKIDWPLKNTTFEVALKFD